MKARLFLIAFWVCLVLAGLPKSAFAWGDYQSNPTSESSYSTWDNFKAQNNYQETQNLQLQSQNWFTSTINEITTSINNFFVNTANFFQSTWNNITSFTDSVWNNVTSFLGFKSQPTQTPVTIDTPKINQINVESPSINAGLKSGSNPALENGISSKANTQSTIEAQSLGTHSKSAGNQIAADKFSDYERPEDIMNVPKDLTLPIPISSTKQSFVDYAKQAGLDPVDKRYCDYQELFRYEQAKMRVTETAPNNIPQSDKISQDTTKQTEEQGKLEDQVKTTQDQAAQSAKLQETTITSVQLSKPDSAVMPVGPKISLNTQIAADAPDIIYTPKTFNDHLVGVLTRTEQDYDKSSSHDNTGFTFLGMAIGETFKEIGSLFTSYEYKPHILNAKNPEDIKVIYSNGIANDNPEGFAPSYAGNFKVTLSKNGEDKNKVYLLPLYENGHIVTDAVNWLADWKTNKLTNEVVAKMDNELKTRPADQKNNPMTAVLYSGSYNPFMKALNERPDYNVATVVTVGGAWPVNEKTYFNQDALNPHLKLVVNIYGSNDILYKTGFAGNMKFNNVETVNIEILGAGHWDYFDNPTMSNINIKTKAFITRVVISVDRSRSDLNDILEAGFVKYDTKSQTYLVDANKINIH